MPDIRKRVGKKGCNYQVRYPSKVAKSGYTYVSFKTLKEARAFLDVGLPKDRHSQPHPEVTEVKHAIDRWLDTCEFEGRRGEDPVSSMTMVNYRWRAEIMKSYPWAKPLTRLEGPDIVSFRSWLLRNYPRDTAKKVLSSLRSVFLEMVTQGVLTTDPSAGVVIQKSRSDTTVAIPTIEEIRGILLTADSLADHENYWIALAWQRYRPMIYLALETGMRPQEYLAVRDADLQASGLTVTQALKTDHTIGPPKSAAGTRYLPLGAETMKMIKSWQKTRGKQNGGLLFPAEEGKPQRYNNYLNRCWYKLMEHAGMTSMADGSSSLQPRYTPYALRHFYASMLIAKNRDLKTIQDRMGHADATMTLNVYGHLIRRREAESKKEEPSILEEIYAACGESVANSANSLI
jgi:integrase